MMDAIADDNPWHRQRRPSWASLAVVLPVAVLLDGSLSDTFTHIWHMRSSFALALVGGTVGPSEVQKVLARVIGHAAMPWLLVALLFKSMRIDAWLAPNRLAVACLLCFHGLYLGQWAYRLFMAGAGGIPFVRGWAGDALSCLLTLSLIGGLSMLALSTAWHRGAMGRWVEQDWFKRLWAEM